jgi:organic hydroperoxide reductase OsmC/OhrA
MIEFIWDRGRSGTATAPNGASMTVGDAADFSPEDLIATAAAGCLMRTFLRRADEAGMPVLSYASAASVGLDERDARPHVVIRTYVVVPESVPTREVEHLLHDSLTQSPIGGLLVDRVTCQADIRRLCGACTR